LLFVGYLSCAKGVDRVIEIARRLSAKSLDFRLTFVGDGPERSRLEEIVNKNSMGDRVHFTGWQPITALHQYYRKAHLFIFPSKSEGWPKVLSEAMAHGVVPLASDVGSIKEILVETGAGRAFSLGNNQLYIDAIFEYAQDPQLWKDTSLKGINAAKKFTYEHYLSDVKRMFYKYWQVKLDNE
jgi:glycosyltransferase involved in cell wall biosynthesis